MPLFDYKCVDCKLEFEELVNKSNKEVVCPKCKSKNVKRFLVSKGTSFILTGKGWTPKFNNKQ